MNKYLEAFKQIKIGDYSLLENKYIHEEELNIVEEGLNALAIIKNKEVDMNWFKYCWKAEQYNNGLPEGRKKLTKEEFKFLKGVIG